MLNRYRDVDLCKEDIRQFNILVRKDIGYISESDMTSIAKVMIFFEKDIFISGC